MRPLLTSLFVVAVASCAASARAEPVDPASADPSSSGDGVDRSEDCVCSYDDAVVETCSYRGQWMAKCPDSVPPAHVFHHDLKMVAGGWLRLATGPRWVDRRDTQRFYRAELDFSFHSYRRRSSFVGTVLLGLEGWQGNGESGIGLPLQMTVGMRTPLLFFSAGGGLNVLSADFYKASHDYGMLTPFASQALGFDFEWVRVMFDLREEWRWHAVNDTSRRAITGGLALAFRFDRDLDH